MTSTTTIDYTGMFLKNLLNVLAIIRQANFNVVGEKIPYINQEFATLERLANGLQEGELVITEPPVPETEVPVAQSAPLDTTPETEVAAGDPE
jgi:hypothetical protein